MLERDMGSARGGGGACGRVSDATQREGDASSTYLVLYRRSPGIGLRWWLDSTAVHRLIDRRRDGRVRYGVHAGGIRALRRAALQGRVVCVLDDRRVMGSLVGAVCWARLWIGVWVSSLLAVVVSSASLHITHLIHSVHH
jgi:hypothetical protein